MALPPVVSTIAAIAGTAFQVVGAMQQAQAQKAQADYSAAVARNNAIIAEQNAADIVQRGEIARDVQRRRVDQTIGAARSAIAGAGLLVDDPAGTTPALLLDDIRTAGQFDIMTLKANIDREERRALIQGQQFEAEAGLFDLQASSINPMLAGAAAGFQNSQTLMNMFPSGPVFPGGGKTLGATRPVQRPATLMA